MNVMQQHLPSEQGTSRFLGPVLLAVGAALLLLAFREGLGTMLQWWGEPEYSHGWLIPFMSAYLLAVRAGRLEEAGAAPGWFGVVLVALALLLFALGELSALYVIVQYAFVLALWGLIAVQVGLPGLRVLWPVLAFMLFMVPLPRFIQWNLSNELQLLSSGLGAGMLRAIGVPVFLEGNVIDLGSYRLQVVEACSGLRYLFPLLCFGLLSALLFRGPRWQRILIVLSSVPIAIFMNSFRIAMTGVLVNRFGSEAADGFLHYFEGWVIFTACLALMFLEMVLLARLGGRRLDEVFDLVIPGRSDFNALERLARPSRPLVAAAALLALGALGSFAMASRTEDVPARPSLASFPLVLGDWRGHEMELSAVELDALKLTDYTMASYDRGDDGMVVELYVAYYESQRKGASIHSPKACLPGGGWQIEEFGRKTVEGAGIGAPLKVNRARISLGGERLLVYYWFMQRGRIITNEYLAKWYIFQDSLLRNRTDGALVRVATPIEDAASAAEAEQRLDDFVRRARPRLDYYIPGWDAPPAAATPAGTDPFP